LEREPCIVRERIDEVQNTAYSKSVHEDFLPTTGFVQTEQNGTVGNNREHAVLPRYRPQQQYSEDRCQQTEAQSQEDLERVAVRRSFDGALCSCDNDQDGRKGQHSRESPGEEVDGNRRVLNICAEFLRMVDILPHLERRRVVGALERWVALLASLQAFGAAITVTAMLILLVARVGSYG